MTGGSHRSAMFVWSLVSHRAGISSGKRVEMQIRALTSRRSPRSPPSDVLPMSGANFHLATGARTRVIVLVVDGA